VLSQKAMEGMVSYITNVGFRVSKSSVKRDKLSTWLRVSGQETTILPNYIICNSSPHNYFLDIRCKQVHNPIHPPETARRARHAQAFLWRVAIATLSAA
jgi:hypothetical protein